jgi:hypothetical protein
MFHPLFIVMGRRVPSLCRTDEGSVSIKDIKGRHATTGCTSRVAVQGCSRHAANWRTGRRCSACTVPSSHHSSAAVVTLPGVERAVGRRFGCLLILRLKVKCCRWRLSGSADGAARIRISFDRLR